MENRKNTPYTEEFIKKYDVIIIGSGIGGLSCGALLSKNGLKILILEQYKTIGGCCSSFKKDDFVFDLAADFLFEYENLISQNLKDLGIENRVEFIKIDPLYEFIFPDFRIKIPKNMNMFLEELIKIAPEEEKNLYKFFDEIENIHDSIENVRFELYEKYNIVSIINMIKNPKIIKYAAKYRKMDWRQFLNKYFENEKLKAILSAECLFLALPPSKVPVFSMASIISMEHKYGLVYPKGGMINLANAYEHAIKNFNGDIRVNSKVSKILTKNKQCIGVELSNGEKIFSTLVISNAEIRETYFSLIGRDNIDQNFAANIDRLESSLSVFKLCLGTDTELKIEPLIIKSPGYDIESIYKKIKNMETDNNYYLICTKSQSIHVLLPYSYEIKGNDIPKKIIEDLNKVFPEISKHILCESIITPKILEKIANRHKGVACIHTNILDNVARNRTPIKNMYLVGSSAYPGGGINNVLVSGIITSKMILKNWRN